MKWLSRFIYPIASVIKDIFVTQTIQLDGQKPATPIEFNQIISFGRAEVKILPNGLKIIYLTVGATAFTAPATPENLKLLSKFIPIYELDFEEDGTMKETEIPESFKNTMARKVTSTRVAQEIKEIHTNLKLE